MFLATFRRIVHVCALRIREGDGLGGCEEGHGSDSHVVGAEAFFVGHEMGTRRWQVKLLHISWSGMCRVGRKIANKECLELASSRAAKGVRNLGAFSSTSVEADAVAVERWSLDYAMANFLGQAKVNENSVKALESAKPALHF